MLEELAKRNIVLKLWISLMSVCFVGFGAFELWTWSGPRGNLVQPVVASVSLALTGGLWLFKSWARKTAKFLIGFLIIVAIAGTFNPFFAMDYHAAHGTEPDWWVIATKMVPFIVMGLSCFWALDKYKNEFR